MSDSVQPHRRQPTRLPCPWDSPGKNTGVGSLSLLQQIFLTRTERDTCIPLFIAALFTIARTWKQPRCPSTDEWIKKLWYIYTVEYYSAIKRNAFESVLISAFPLGWPWEAQSSPRVARESWALRSSHCRAEETSPRRVSGT